MSEQATKTATYPDLENGQMITIITDKETAKAIHEYNSICNQIQSFKIDSQVITGLSGQICEIYKAQSPKLKIWCIRKYLPLIDDDVYECRIERKNDKANKDPELILGGVEYLYYKLLSKNSGRAK